MEREINGKMVETDPEGYLVNLEDWSEELAGTCGVGSCIITREAITIHQSDHFDLTHVPLSCTAAPIFDTSGNLAAVLTGSPAAPVLTATRERLQLWSGPVALIAASAEGTAPSAFPPVGTREVAASGASDARAVRLSALLPHAFGPDSLATGKA